MLRSIANCLACMANPHFLGLQKPGQYSVNDLPPSWGMTPSWGTLPPWQKDNSGETPWTKEFRTLQPPGKQKQEDPSVINGMRDSTRLIWQQDRRELSPDPPAREGREAREASEAPEEVTETRVRQREAYVQEGEPLQRRAQRALPRFLQRTLFGQAEPQELTTTEAPYTEVRRGWPDPRQKGERRMTAANYGAMEIHGFFGLIDDGSDAAGRTLIVHVPRYVKGYFMDIKQGDVIHVYHAKGLKIGGALTVLSTGRHKYYNPGRKVTTCTICVPEEQWAPFASF